MKNPTPFDARLFDELLTLALRGNDAPADAVSGWLFDVEILTGILAVDDWSNRPQRQVIAEMAQLCVQLANATLAADPPKTQDRPWSVADGLGVELDPKDLAKLRELADRWGVTPEGAAVSLLGDAVREVKE
jgi:hypothetical protein